MHKTADLCDQYPDEVQVLEPIFRNYGRKQTFEGEVYTLKVFEDNSLVKELLNSPGNNRVLVIDGGGSNRCALVGDNLATQAVEQGWSGIIVFGCIRDSGIISEISIGLKAIGTNPRRSIKRGEGQKELGLHFAGVKINPGDYLYADEDGIIIASHRLS